MFIKKTAVALGMLFSCANLFAGVEDWYGKFIIQDSAGEKHMVQHIPTATQFIFLRVGTCLYLSKGSKIDNFTSPEDVNLCTASNIETFTTEVQKLGVILNNAITLGPTYLNDFSANQGEY